jgi:large repetitive protein
MLVAALVVLVAGPLASSAGAAGPSVTIDSPTSGTETKEPAPLFSGSSSDTLDSVTVKLFEGPGTAGAPLPALAPAMPVGGAWSIQSPSLADGTYTALAEQEDSGTLERGVSAEVTFTVDTTTPVVSLNPVASSTNDTTPTFTGALGEAAGDAQAVTVTVRTSPGGVVAQLGSAAVSGGGWTYTPPTLGQGAYTVQAAQSDSAGNVGTSTAAPFTIDTTNPTPQLAQPASPAKNRTPTFTWTPGSAERDLPSVTLRVLNGANKVVGEGSSANGTLTLGASEALSDGTYTAYIEQSDEAGNVGYSGRTFTIDNVAPSVGIGSPGEEAHLNSAKPSFSGNAGNVSGDGERVTLNIYQGSGTTGTHESIAISRHHGESWSEPEGPHLADGTYTAQVLQEDTAGNVGAAKHTFTIETNTPHVTLNELSSYTADATPSFSGGVDTTKGVVESVTLRIFRGSSAAESAEEAEQPIVVSGDGSTWSTGAIAHLPDGTYTAQAEQENLAGTPGFSAPSMFTVDTLAPQPTLSAPQESAGTEPVYGTAGDAQGDRGQIAVELFQGPTTAAEAFEVLTVKATGAAWSAAFAGLGAGEYTAIARQSDEAGNAGQSAPQRFTVVAPPPSSPAPPAPPSPPVASFTWVPASPAVGQTVSLASNSTGVSSPLSGFAWDVGGGQFVLGGPLMTTSFATPGAHVVRLQVSDSNGLSSVATRTIDVAAQALKLMQPFPIVRIAGSENASGVRVKLLTVQAPATTKVAVTCKGRGCKTKSESRVATASSKSRSKAGAIMLAFPRFQRALQAGAVLQIRVSKAGEIGKFTSFTIRRNKLPVRVDACLRPTSSSPSPCPSQ